MSGNGSGGTDEPVTPDVVEAAPGEIVEPEAEPVVDVRDVQIAELEAKLREAEGRLRAVSKAYADQRNEMAAFRQRVESQDKVRLERKEADVVETFFEPVQNLHRSLEAGEGDGLVPGLRLVHQQFMDALNKLGLEQVPGEGAPFDPNVHDAVDVQPVDDPAADNQVVRVHSDGWRVRGRVIRPARVTVGRFQAAEAEA